MSQKELIVVLGQTATGKTAKAIELAKEYKTEIISADSRQFYKEMKIGVASPTDEELAQAPHHFIGNISIHNPYSIGQYEKEAIQLIEFLFQKHDKLILVGGSGMYIQAVCEGIDALPQTEAKIREELNFVFETKGLEPLLAELKEKDISYYEKVDKQNPRRIIRALEVCRQSDRAYSSFLNKEKTQRNFKITKIGIAMPQNQLYSRIDKRVDAMIEQGLLQEAQGLYPYRDLQALHTVGYQELFPYLEGKNTLEEAIHNIKNATHHYAKRQATWFKKDKSIIWAFLACLFMSFGLKAQDSNLVFNPSFEEHIACPQRIDPYGYMSEVLGWWQPTGGSADYYNKCGTKQCNVPKNKLGIQMPRTGVGMVGIYTSKTTYREYVQTELKEPLQKGETYYLSFYVSLSEYSDGSVATIGGLFTKERISDKTRQMLTSSTLQEFSQGVSASVATSLEPQVVNPYSRPLIDTKNWTKIEGTFVANGGEAFLTLGNFYPAEQSNVIDLKETTHLLPGAYYYIDDVYLQCLTCSGHKDLSPETTTTSPKDTVQYQVGQVVILKNIFFDFDKSVLLPQSFVELHNLIGLLTRYPKMKIELSGHTDSFGSTKYNENLSLQRVKAVYDYLIQAGIDKNRLTYLTYGKTKPIATNLTDEGRAQNRRVEFKIMEM